MPASFFSNLIG